MVTVSILWGLTPKVSPSHVLHLVSHVLHVCYMCVCVCVHSLSVVSKSFFFFRLISLVFRIVWFVSAYFFFCFVLFCFVLLCPSLYNPLDCRARQAPLSMEFSRQQYWRGLPFSPPGDLPDPGIESTSLVSPALAGRFFATALSGKPSCVFILL